MRYIARFIAIQTTDPVNTGYDWTIFDNYRGVVVRRGLNLEQAMLLAAFMGTKYEVDYRQF